jgi:amidase
MDPTFLSATELADLVRTGKAGALELLDHYIGRVERLDTRINAVVVRDFDRARLRAKALDSQQDKSAPLFGVPVTLKESFDIAGLPTTRGHAQAKDVPAVIDALPVQRLKDAGAVIFGKTNVPVDLADWQSYNPVYGATSNPWNTDHTPGGSSGGSAAALAAGLTGLDVGTDIGGSIRVPAHYCGVFGHKTTYGICPSYGDPKTSAAAPIDIAVLGPMARAVQDLAVTLDVLAGPDPDETGLTFTLPKPPFTALKELRVAVWTQQEGQATDSETVAAISGLADFLERAGATVSRTARPDFDPTEAYHLYLQLLDAAWSARRSDEVVARCQKRKEELTDANQTADDIMIRMANVTHREWLALNERRHKLRRLWSAFFREWHVLLCPAIATTALPHRQDGETWERTITVEGREMAYNDMLFWPGLTCGFHLPATVIPIGMTGSGLPIGVQIAGPIHGDLTTLAVAHLLEREGYRFKPPPGW